MVFCNDHLDCFFYSLPIQQSRLTVMLHECVTLHFAQMCDPSTDRIQGVEFLPQRRGVGICDEQMDVIL